MGELAIRRDRTLAAGRRQTSVRTERTGAAASSKETASAEDIVSDALRQKFDGVRQAGIRNGQIQSQKNLQTGEAALSEVQDRLARMAALVEEAASGNGGGKELQDALEELTRQIDRILHSASSSGAPLFLDGKGGAGVDALLAALQGDAEAGTLPDWLLEGLSNTMGVNELLRDLGVDPDKNPGGAELLRAILNAPDSAAANRLKALYLGAVILKGSPSGPAGLEEAVRGLEALLSKIASGVSADEAIASLTGGAFTSLLDFQNQFSAGTAPGLPEFLTGLLADGGILLDAALLDALDPSLLLSGVGLEDSLLTGLLDILSSGGAMPDWTSGGAAEDNPPPFTVQQFGNVRAAGRDLSGLSTEGAESGGLTVGGSAGAVIQSPAALALRLTGDGTVLLRSPEGASVLADAPGARLFVLGRTVLEPLSLARDASLTLGGSGLIRLAGLRGEAGSVLRLAAGTAAALEVADGKSAGTLPVVVVQGPVSFAANGVRVQDTAGRTLQPFDVVWKTLLPGWAGITSLEIDGRQARLNLLQGEPARLWLDKGDRGHPLSLFFRGWDTKGNPTTHYAALRWDQQWMRFEEMDMYPNPFQVTGGEMGRDWVYEEETRTLRILSPLVTAISGGSGTGADQSPYWGRLALADGIGRMGLTLRGVVCRAEMGSGFELGAGNDVLLLLENGTENRFEGAPGYAGVALGEDSALCVDISGDSDSGRIPAGFLAATGGRGGAGIGRDAGDAPDPNGRIVIRNGVIHAKGRGGGAGIGAGKGCAVKNVEISGGEVHASGKKGGAGIGGALKGSVGEIVLLGGRITATADSHAAAIGAGLRGNCGPIRIGGTARVLKAVGGDPGADIGGCLFGVCEGVFLSGAADIGQAKLWVPKAPPEEEHSALPQFRLSVPSMGLDRINLHSPDDVRKAKKILEADRQWVSQVQEAYSALYSRLEQNGMSRRERAEAAGLLRETAAAGAVLDLVRQTIRQPSAQALRTHSGQETGSVQQLLD